MVCAISGTWRGKTSSLSGDRVKENSIGISRTRPSWCVLRWTLSLRPVQQKYGPLGLKLQSLNIQSPKDFETAFQAAANERADAVLFRVRGPLLSPHRTEVAALAVKSRLPAIYEAAEEVEAGGLMSYGVNDNDLYRRAAYFVDRILKGAKPTDLPVEQPTKFELVINLKTAKQIGVMIPHRCCIERIE